MALTEGMQAIGFLTFRSYDQSCGDSGNTFELDVSADAAELDERYIIAAPGTEYGGIVREVESYSDSAARRYVKYSGMTFTGMLSERVVVPPSGSDHYTLEGEANAAIGDLLAYIGLDGFFKASEANSGVELDSDMERFCTAYDGLRAGLMASDARLDIAFDPDQKRIVLSAVPRETHGSAYSSENSPVTVKVAQPYNHLICAGQGELQQRVVLHLYADKDGNVSDVQSLFGTEQRDLFYENTGADAEELREGGVKRLKELQDVNGVSIDIGETSEDLYPLDDLIAGFDSQTGVSAVSNISKKILKVDSEGRETYRYEPGEVDSSRVSVAGGSTGGGMSYTAGAGITIVGGEISAEVTQAELDAVSDTAQSAMTEASNANSTAASALSTAEGKADSGHKHSASDITSGTLPIERGGTGASTAKAAEFNIVNPTEVTDDTNDNSMFTFTFFDRTSAKGSLYKRPASNVWSYIATKIRSVFGFSSANVLPIANGGTGAATAATARTNIGAAASSHTHTKSQITDFPSSLKNPSALTVKTNGTSAAVYDGSAAKEVNITASNVGAAASSHKHSAADVTSGTLAAARGGTGNANGTANPTPNQMTASNLNDVKTPGFYFSGGDNTCTNKPTGVDAFGLIVYKTAGGYTTQELTEGNSNPGKRWIRQYANSAWSSWGYVYTTLHKPSASDVGAAASGHTHNYAGSSSAGGAANSAAKLSTARTIALTGAVTGSVSFDGSKNVTITTEGQGAAANFLAAHPVGSYYETTSSANPGTTYGGTWSKAPSLDGFKWLRTA